MTPSYALLDFGDGLRLEQWGPYRLTRPDPTAVGEPTEPALWESVDAAYEGEKGKGEWKRMHPVPESWPVTFGDVLLTIKLSPYKHTGAFPEQEANWQWMRELARTSERSLTVLNLFAYTGGATVALAKDGHHLTHVDASRPTIGWAKDNAALNSLPAESVRWMLEDASDFVAKERKRGKKYDAVILDPPAFGHSPTGKTWRVERDLAPLLEDCAALLSDTPAFLLLNGYAQNDTPESFGRLLGGVLHTKSASKNFRIQAGELLLRARDGRELSTGIVARCGFLA